MNNQNNYLRRLIEHTIEESMKTNGCVVLEGAKWCGKSTTAEQFAKTIVKLQKPATFRQYKLLSDLGDPELLKGEKPILFDEWQKLPDLWDYIRADIDEMRYKGAFILTGSAKPIEDKNRHSGIGRIKKITMRTMSLWESGESSGSVSLQELFKGNHQISGRQNYNLRDIAYLICRGGWPEAAVQKDKELALKFAKDYVDGLVTSDLTSVDDIKRNPIKARAILKSYARNISTSAPITTIHKDIENKIVADSRTLDSYLNAFAKLFVIEDTEAWAPILRSKTSIRVSSTRHFSDPSIAAAVLDATADDLMNDLNSLGLLFENFAIRDLKIYTQMLGGHVANYRDKSGLEADVIVHLNNGKWGAIEIKLGGEKLINEGAKNLLALAKKIDDEKMQSPTFLMILTAVGEFTYRRADGVLVVPIGCLKN
ncbi:MAG: ATP-binding protein [Erysipelotrichales bacterium]|nr:ATP-binding protein [Erysipelotrichales bacterium]